MALDKHVLQQWIAGAEIRFRKTRKPLARIATIPFVGKLGSVAETTQEYVLTERIDLTRAHDFQAQEGAEDILVASMQLPFLGKRGVGNDSGLAVARFNYTDKEGGEHDVIAICAYTISGVVGKTRELRKVMTIPLAPSANQSENVTRLLLGGGCVVKLEGESGALEIERLELGAPGTPADEDIRVSVRVSVHGYSAEDQSWLLADELAEFIERMVILETKRQGSAVLESASPDDLNLEFYSTDSAAHMAVKGHVGWHEPSGHFQQLRFGFDFEPDKLPGIVRGFRKLSRS